MVIGYGNIRAMDNESSVTARMLLVRHWCCWMNELTPSEVAKPSTLSNQTPLLKRGPFQNASIHQWTKDLMREKPLKHYSVRVEWWRRKLLVGKATTKRLLGRLFSCMCVAWTTYTDSHPTLPPWTALIASVSKTTSSHDIFPLFSPLLLLPPPPSCWPCALFYVKLYFIYSPA